MAPAYATTLLLLALFATGLAAQGSERKLQQSSVRIVSGSRSQVAGGAQASSSVTQSVRSDGPGKLSVKAGTSVSVKVDPPKKDEECRCNGNKAPTPTYTCEEQKKFGKCDADWMVKGEFCACTCGRCGSDTCKCNDNAPSVNWSCADQKRFGKCDAQWMRDAKYCECTCEYCSK